MKHIFIINPKAGKVDLSIQVADLVKDTLKKEDFLLYLTKGHLDAKEFVHRYCEEHPEEKRFYSCGGDGTLNEVVNGAVGFDNTTVTCYPIGSGNDFIKYFGKAADFLKLPDLLDGEAINLDLLRYNGHYIVNIYNIGFDADVAERMIRYRRLPLVGGKGAYILGVFASFFRKLTKKLKITIDGEELYQGDVTLCAMANAICYGGGFYCAPHAQVNDGLVDIVAVKKISRLKFLKFIKSYKNGKHLDREDLRELILFKRGKLIEIESPEPINCCFDGEILKDSKIRVEIIPNKIKFVVPKHLLGEAKN
ncbi:MAG: diacylglycerol kinase family protein [Bacilli bacterium]|nr:diacylglycerol kinase family protein [Bacilli bacterium]